MTERRPAAAEPEPRGRNISQPDVAKEAALSASAEASGTIFAAMPFAASFDDVYHVAMYPAARSVGSACVRVDQAFHGSDSVEEARRQIQACRAVIADVTNAQPDVMYEVGYAHALGKPTVQVCSTAYGDLPFSIRNRDTILYQPGRTYHLSSRLSVYLIRLLG